MRLTDKDKFEIRFIENPNKEVAEINSYEDFQLFLDQSVMELIKNSPPIPYQYDKNNYDKATTSSLMTVKRAVEYAELFSNEGEKMTNPLEDKAKLLDLTAPSVSITGNHEERTTKLMSMFNQAEERIEEQRKTGAVNSIVSFWQSLYAEDMDRVAKESKDIDLIGKVKGKTDEI